MNAHQFAYNFKCLKLKKARKFFTKIKRNISRKKYGTFQLFAKYKLTLNSKSIISLKFLFKYRNSF